MSTVSINLSQAMTAICCFYCRWSAHVTWRCDIL